MKRRFASFPWQQLGVLLTPTLVSLPTLAKSTRLLAARARRGGSLAGRVRGNTRAILQRLMREDEEEVEEEENSDSDFSVSSDLGPILNVIL